MELVLYAVIVLGVLGAIFGAILAIASKFYRRDYKLKNQKFPYDD